MGKRFSDDRNFRLIIAGILVVVLTILLINNATKEQKSLEDYAWEYIDGQVEIYKGAQWGKFKILDKKITKLEQASSFEGLLDRPVELWRLEYRLKVDDPEGVVLAGGMNMEDGWLTEDSSMGKPYLVFTYQGDKLVYLGNLNSQDIIPLDTKASQEVAIRQLLEDMDLIPKETFEGNHVVIQFPLSTGERAQLLLSQPVKQGTDGIWAVERWMDGNGFIYYDIPAFEEDITIKEYYFKLQAEVDEGNESWLLDPLEVGYEYIVNTLGQVLVKRSDLVIIDPATIDDFLTTPESHYIGYITMMNLEESLFHLDRVEFLTQEDEERAKELGLDINYDMPSGFYVYNQDTYPMAFYVSDDTEYLLLDWVDLSKHKNVTKKDFIEYNKNLSYSPLYNIYTKDGFVTRIVEQYIP